MSNVNELFFRPQQANQKTAARCNLNENPNCIFDSTQKIDELESPFNIEKTIATKPADTETKTVENAPSPKLQINGEEKIATFVVDLSENKLYRYDEKGTAIEQHSVASGKKSTPTHTGVRLITHVEKYPYNTAPKGTKRRRNPKDYGPYILILTKVDPNTGKNIGSNGEFIHGNRNPASIGKYASHGCIRMHNDVISRLAKEVESGSYVLIKE